MLCNKLELALDMFLGEFMYNINNSPTSESEKYLCGDLLLSG
jgi:hypothetical protein